MRILVITDLYPIKDDEKYTPKTIKNFVDCWENQGHEVKVIKPNFLFNSFLRKKPFYKSGIYGNIENINYFLPFMGDIKNKIKTLFAPDIVIAHMPSGVIFANKLGVLFTAAVHISDLEVLTNPIYGKYFKTQLEEAYKNAQKIACRSFAIRDKFLKLYPHFAFKTFVAPSGIDKKLIRKRNWQEKEKIRVLTCGQFIKRKNIDKVIEACNQFDNIELSVIGSGKQEKYLKKLSDKVFFMGQIPHNQVLEKMQNSDIFVLPSVNETFGMVYLEAMASGCITVCTEGDGIDGIIEDGINGFLSGDDLRETLERILRQENKQQILDNAYKTIMSYNEEDVARYYLSNLV